MGWAKFGLPLGLVIGLLCGWLEGITYSIHGGFGAFLIALAHMACLGGFGVGILGWLASKAERTSTTMWGRVMIFSVGAEMGLFGAFALVMSFMGRAV